MGIHTLSLDDDLMEQLDKETPARGKSRKVEELIREFVDDKTDRKADLNIVKSADLTPNQEKVVYRLIEKGKGSLNEAQWNSFVEACGVTRKDYKDKCFKAIVESDKVPYKRTGRRSLESVQIECRCGTRIHVGPLSKNDGVCPNCDRVIVKFDEAENQDMEVVKA